MTIFYNSKNNAFYDDNIVSSIPDGSVVITKEQHTKIFDDLSTGLKTLSSQDGYPITVEVPDLPEEKIIGIYSNIVTVHLNRVAKQFGYDNINVAISYAEEASVPKFQVEGQEFRKWRSLCWDYFFKQIELFKAGSRTLPDYDKIKTGVYDVYTNRNDLVLELPKIGLQSN